MANANPVVEAAAKSVQAANSTPPADAGKSAAPTAPADTAPVEAEQQAFSPDTEDAIDRRGSGTSTMPREWLDSTKVIKHTATHADTFGALTSGDDKGAPADVYSGNSTAISEEDVAADESGITSGASVKAEDGDAEETTETAADTTDYASAAEAAEDKAADKVETKKDDAPAKTEAMKQTRAIRRTALDAMRIEAEKRQLESRLRDERKARETALSEKAAFEKRLREAPVDERLRLIGIRDKDALLEMQLRGEIPDFKEPEPAKTDKPEAAKPTEDPEKAALAKRIADLEARDRDREAKALQAQQAATAQAAAANARAILAAPEVAADVKLTLASGPEAISDVIARAEQLWVASGAKPGDINRHVIAAAKEAEPILRERYAPILAAMGVKPGEEKVAAKKEPGPVIQNQTAKPKPSVAGKKLAARGSNLEDDLPLDPMLRDAIIKRERGWGGSQQ